MEKMITAAGSSEKPNWLLRGFLLFSVGVHVLILGYTAGWHRQETVRHIELEMRTEAPPPARSIPMPPQRKQLPLPDVPRVRPLPTEPAVKPAAVPSAPKLAAVRPSPVEPLAAPEPPQIPPSQLIAWRPSLAPSPPQAEPAASGERADSETAAAVTPVSSDRTGEYFSMVRTLIEKRKKYPYSARRRRVQGKVVVRFIIEPDGNVNSVTLVKRSRSDLLDQAALEAVKACAPFPVPPEQLFSGPVPLEISLNFMLM